jgi:hypothetical protein
VITRRNHSRRRIAAASLTTLFLTVVGIAQPQAQQLLPNNLSFLNPVGTAATFSNAGSVDLQNAFHTLNGDNPRSCESCHAATLKDVVLHYEAALGFQFTAQEREDLVAFMQAL